jgi:hypothetical protein
MNGQRRSEEEMGLGLGVGDGDGDEGGQVQDTLMHTSWKAQAPKLSSVPFWWLHSQDY